MGFVAASSAQKNWSKDLWTDPFSCLSSRGILGNVLPQQLKIPNQQSGKKGIPSSPSSSSPGGSWLSHPWCPGSAVGTGMTLGMRTNQDGQGKRKGQSSSGKDPTPLKMCPCFDSNPHVAPVQTILISSFAFCVAFLILNLLMT